MMIQLPSHGIFAGVPGFPGVTPKPTPSSGSSPHPPATSPAPAPSAPQQQGGNPSPRPRRWTVNDSVTAVPIGEGIKPGIVPRHVLDARRAQVDSNVLHEFLDVDALKAHVLLATGDSLDAAGIDFGTERAFVVEWSAKSLATTLVVDFIYEKEGQIVVVIGSRPPKLFGAIPQKSTHPMLVFTLPREQIGDLPVRLQTKTVA